MSSPTDDVVKKKKKKKNVDIKKYQFDNNSSTGARNFIVDSPVTPEKVEKKKNFKTAVLGERKDSSDEDEGNFSLRDLEEKTEELHLEDDEEEKKNAKHRKKSLFSEMNDEIFGDFNEKPKPKIKAKRTPIQINVPEEEIQIIRKNSANLEEKSFTPVDDKSPLGKLKQEVNLKRPTSQPSKKEMEKKIEETKSEDSYKVEDDFEGSTFFLLSGKQKEVAEKKVNFGLIGKKLDEKSDPIVTRRSIQSKEGYLYKKSSDGERAHKRYCVAEKDKKKDRIIFSIFKTEMDYKKKESPIQECYIHEELIKDIIEFKTVKRSVTVDKKQTFTNCFWIVPDQDERKKFTLWCETSKEVSDWMFAIHSMLLFRDQVVSKPKKKNIISEIFDL